MIRAAGLTKYFGSLRAVDHLSFEAAPGEIYGLLGPNGAGQTTAMRLFACLLAPTSRTAVVAGDDATNDPGAGRAPAGVLTGVPGPSTRMNTAGDPALSV